MAQVVTSCSFEELIQSKLFTFYIGKERKEFVVHSKAIAAISPYFHALVNNDMTESQQAFVEYEDIEPGDFARFVEYAYRHDYTIPSWTREESAVEAGATDSVPGSPSSNVSFREVAIGTSPSISKKYKRRMQVPQSETLDIRLRSRDYLLGNDPKAEMLAGFKHEVNFEHEQILAPIFLAHAWLYTFACMRLVEPLKRLALHKLHTALLNSHIFDQRVVDVMELVRYAYDHGENRKEDGTIEDLRMLVVEYIASELSTFRDHKDFVDLLEEGGEFVADFWRIAVKEKLM